MTLGFGLGVLVQGVSCKVLGLVFRFRVLGLGVRG